MAYFDNLKPDVYSEEKKEYNDFKGYMYEFKTPLDIVKNNDLHWTPQFIGIFFSAGLIRGFKNARYSLVSESDVLRLYALRVEDKD